MCIRDSCKAGGDEDERRSGMHELQHDRDRHEDQQQVEDILRRQQLAHVQAAATFRPDSRFQIGGPIKTSAVTANTAAEIGCVKKIVRSPWLIASARRNCCSASGPRIIPTSTGATGMSKRRIRKPITPMM